MSLISHGIEALAMAGTLERLGVGRREGAWRASFFHVPSRRQPVIPGLEEIRIRASLPPMSPPDVLRADRSRTGVTTGWGGG